MSKYTKADIGFIPFSEPDRNEQKYYEGIIAWAKEEFGFEPDEEHDWYPRLMLEQPMFEFPDSHIPNLFADFVDTWNFLCDQCEDGVIFTFVDGELMLVEDKEG